MPLASCVLQGLINLRGQIVMVVDLRRQLQLEPRDEHAVPMNVVVRSEEGALSLLVDEIGDVVEVDDSTFELPPETVPAALRAMVLGVHKLPKLLMHLLDTERVCRSAYAYDRKRNGGSGTNETVGAP